MGTTIFECAVTPWSCWLVPLEARCALHIETKLSRLEYSGNDKFSLLRSQGCILISTIILPCI